MSHPFQPLMQNLNTCVHPPALITTTKRHQTDLRSYAHRSTKRASETLHNSLSKKKNKRRRKKERKYKLVFITAIVTNYCLALTIKLFIWDYCSMAIPHIKLTTRSGLGILTIFVFFHCLRFVPSKAFRMRNVHACGSIAF